MCGGSANSRCLPSMLYGDAHEPDGVEATPGESGGAGLEAGVAGGRLEPDAVGGAAADDDQVAGLRGAATAVAEDVAALDLVDVEHAGRDVERAAVAEPQCGADPGPDLEVLVGGAQPVELVGREVADVERAGRQRRRRPRVVTSRSTSLRWEPWPSGRWMAMPSSRGRSARPARTSAADSRSRRLRPCRFMLVTSSSRIRAPGCRSSRATASSTRLTVWTTRDAIRSSTSSAAPNGRHGVSTSRSPSKRGATSASSAYVPTATASTPSHCGLAGEPVEAEAVAVALRDRDQAGGLVGDPAQVAAPAVAVDGEGEAHQRRRM